MNSRARIALIISVVCCFALVGASLVNWHFVAALAKIIASIGFIGVALFSGALLSRYGKVLVVGLVLSFIGDAFLIGESKTAFMAGLGAFLFAHVAYVSAFLISGVSVRWTAAALLPIVAIAFFVGRWLAPFTPADLVIPVYLYIIVISAMVITAIGTRGAGGPILILVGAVLFFLSDLSVAALRLVQTEFPTYIWGLPLYYAGQLCLALTASQSRSH